MDNEEQVQSSAEETTEVEEETTDTSDTEETSEETTAESSEETEGDDSDAGDDEGDKRFKDQKRRAEKAEGKRDTYRQRLIDAGLDPETGKPKASDKKDGDYSALEQRVVRAELAAAGVRHPDDQKYVIEAAKRLGVEPGEAVNDEIVAAKLKRMQDARKTKDATPTPQKRGTPSGTNDVAKWADKVAAGGDLPTDPALAEKVQKEIARRSQAAA